MPHPSKPQDVRLPWSSFAFALRMLKVSVNASLSKRRCALLKGTHRMKSQPVEGIPQPVEGIPHSSENRSVPGGPGEALFQGLRQFLTDESCNKFEKTRKLRNTVSKYRSVLAKYRLSTNYVLVYKINTPGFQSQTEGSFFAQVWPQEFCWSWCSRHLMFI